MGGNGARAEGVASSRRASCCRLPGRPSTATRVPQSGSTGQGVRACRPPRRGAAEFGRRFAASVASGAPPARHVSSVKNLGMITPETLPTAQFSCKPTLVGKPFSPHACPPAARHQPFAPLGRQGLAAGGGRDNESSPARLPRPADAGPGDSATAHMYRVGHQVCAGERAGVGPRQAVRPAGLQHAAREPLPVGQRGAARSHAFLHADCQTNTLAM